MNPGADPLHRSAVRSYRDVMTVASETPTSPDALAAPAPGARGLDAAGGVRRRSARRARRLPPRRGASRCCAASTRRTSCLELEADMERWQAALVAGELPEKCGTAVLDDPDAAVDGRAVRPLRVPHLPDLRAGRAGGDGRAAGRGHAADARATTPGCSTTSASGSSTRTPVPARRPTTPASAGTPTGSRARTSTCGRPPPSPSTSTAPRRPTDSCASCPGATSSAPEGQPLGFEAIPGEIAVYAERGDIILHDAHLWHSAARATDDPPLGVRRHIRGGYYGGTPLDEGHGVDDFVKNAAR